MTADHYPGKLSFKNTQHGFSLIEVMVVMVIIAILATGVVFMFANPSAQSKNQAFTLLGELNMARSEAVSRNEEVLVDFILGAADGYQICVDATPAVTPPGNNDCSDESGDNFIQETIFDEDVQYYDPTAVPAGGPSTTPGGTASIIGKSGIILDDATPTQITHFSFEPDGTLEDGIAKNINIVVFVPKKTHNVIYGTPYAVVIAPNTGSIRIRRWTNGAWATK